MIGATYKEAMHCVLRPVAVRVAVETIGEEKGTAYSSCLRWLRSANWLPYCSRWHCWVVMRVYRRIIEVVCTTYRQPDEQQQSNSHDTDKLTGAFGATHCLTRLCMMYHYWR